MRISKSGPAGCGIHDGTSENRRVYEFEVDVDGKKKYIIKHDEDKFGRGPHFHGADDLKGNPLEKGRYNQYPGTLLKILKDTEGKLNLTRVINVSDYKKNKMEFLKRKNRRGNLIKELSNIITVTNEGLLEIEANDSFCKEVFERLTTLKSKPSLNEQDYKKI